MATRKKRKPAPKPLRRVPTQARSRKRLETILNAAAEAFANQGFDATRMETIAQEAGTSIGSVYQFFANKRALFRAVADGCLERSREAFTARINAQTIARPWREIVDEMVDTFASLHSRDVGFRALISNIALYEEFADADQELLEEFTRSTSALLALWKPSLPEARRVIVATVVVNGISGLLIAGARMPGETFEAMLVEIKLMVQRYLQPELEASPAT